MKLTQVVALATLAAGTAACDLSTQASAAVANQSPRTTTKPTLGPEYKKINSFVDFRNKLLTDGWKPVINPDCHDAVLGNTPDEVCSKGPSDIGCHVCDLVPEIFIYTSQGYLTTRYVKDGTPLYAVSYGDIQSLSEPDKHELTIVAWDYKSIE